MSELDLEDGETRQVIPHDQAHRTYIMEVRGADVRVGHSKQYASEGTTLERGLNHKLDNLRGDQLFVHAHDGSASIRMSEAAANVETNPSSDVTVIDGDITIEGTIESVGSISESVDVEVMDSVGDLINPSTEGKQDEMITLLEQIEENTRS